MNKCIFNIKNSTKQAKIITLKLLIKTKYLNIIKPNMQN